MLRELAYQQRVLRALDDYLTLLVEDKTRAEQIAELARAQPNLGLEAPDYTKRAWERLHAAGKLPASRANIPFSSRTDGVGRPVPNVVFKVPTSGGKTYLAAASLASIFGRMLGSNTGFVLWIVPNEAIYSQTLKQLSDRQHPYRQTLDRIAAGRVRILEKTDPLDARDVSSQLCVMVLMLQSANRQTKEALKMFQDRGDVHGFFPPEGDQAAHQMFLDSVPNLDAYDTSTATGSFWPMVKDSLGNVLRLIQPVVVMDEGHHAVSPLAYDTLYGFNPSFVLELTATPKDVAATSGRNPRAARYANILVEVHGTDLDREGMIKMPLNLDPRQGTDWRSTLAASLDRLRDLERDAQRLRAETGRYIRPIMLVQVERTGADQRDGQHIHSLDARDWLKTAGLDDAEIAIKTADTNDLSNPENQDLLSPTNRVRVIITKQALQEGWDCPFAYVLCSLAASSNLTGMTQLIGRILRQPQAEKTGVAALDECYVLTHHAATAGVVQAIKQGLEEDGMGDLVREIRVEDNGNASTTAGAREIPRRDQFRSTSIYLPQVLWADQDVTRPLDYEADILYRLDWRGLDPTPLVERIPINAQATTGQLQRIHLSGAATTPIVAESAGSVAETLRFDPTYAVRMISDLVPNPWIAREIVGGVMAGLTQRGFTDQQQGERAGLIVEELRRWLDQERSRRAEDLFRLEVAAGRIQFRLRLDATLNWQMPFTTLTTQPEGARQLRDQHDGPLQRSLFAPIFEADFNTDEREVAIYLDGEQALAWWHRNVARSQYALQGWRREKIYPDFIFALQRADGTARIAVVETKGDQLAGNVDTEYKQAVLALLSDSFDHDQTVPVGVLELVDDHARASVECDLILMSEWKSKLPKLLERIARHQS
ncbi:MAG: DEAD/DEAH box helicase family protein [Chloroflexota bacterium]|nr:DEAD/DEAH box helicase family protein [Chloroflexota bacterium]